MHDFTVEQAARWDAWQQAYATSARHSDRVARLCATTMLASAFMAIVVALWR